MYGNFNIWNYIDDSNLETNIAIMQTWFYENHMIDDMIVTC